MGDQKKDCSNCLAVALVTAAQAHESSWIAPRGDSGYGEYKVSLFDAANLHGELALPVYLMLYHSWNDSLAWANKILKDAEVANG